MNYELRYEQLALTIDKEHDGMPLMDFLKELRISPKRRQELFEHHAILLNRSDARSSDRLKSGDRLVFHLESGAPDYQPAAEPCTVVYEDDFVFVAHKEPGIIVHDPDDPECLASQAAAWMNEQGIQAPVRYIHRLDRETAGLVLFVKIPLLQGWFDAMLEQKKIERMYLAITEGKGHAGQNFTYNQNIGRDRHISGKYRFSPTGKEAITKVTILDRRHDDLLMRCHLLTGRTHQIRVHLSGNRHPIVNDPLYGVPSLRYKHMGLWADTLRFENPFTKEICTARDIDNPDFAGFRTDR